MRVFTIFSVISIFFRFFQEFLIGLYYTNTVSRSRNEETYKFYPARLAYNLQSISRNSVYMYSECIYNWIFSNTTITILLNFACIYIHIMDEENSDKKDITSEEDNKDEKVIIKQGTCSLCKSKRRCYLMHTWKTIRTQVTITELLQKMIDYINDRSVSLSNVAK